MDVIFAIATSETPVMVSGEVTMFVGGANKKVKIPAALDRAYNLDDLNDLRQILHKRIDSIFDSAQKIYKDKKKETIKVFNCFGQVPEMIEVEID